MTSILGISAYYHDSAAALICDGEIVAAAQEERFSRKKHDAAFPRRAAEYCLAHAGLAVQDLDCIVFYDKPLLKFERLLETYLQYCPRGFPSFLTAMPVWLKEKLYLKTVLRNELSALAGTDSEAKYPLLFSEHHKSHAASAFYPGPFQEAAVICMDGVGEWATTSVWQGKDNSLKPLWQIDFPHSLGLLYSAFTYYCGFKVNSGEYKLMGLAPYGEARYQHLIMEHLLDLQDDGSFHLNMAYFDFATGLTMTNHRFDSLFGGPPRQKEGPLTRREMDLAASVQVVTEEVVLRIARSVREETGSRNLCMAGGVALNCVANGRLLREQLFDNIWIQPAAGDAGGAIGSALAVWHEYYDNARPLVTGDRMSGSYLGPAFDDTEIRLALDRLGAVYEQLENAALFAQAAQFLAEDKVLGWFQGRMEFGPRALGGRSILADPRSERMQSVLNMKIKYRESFRPFAPSVLEERVQDYFDFSGSSPYMLMVAEVCAAQRRQMSADEAELFGIDKLKVPRSTIPAVTHVDYSARIQTVNAEFSPRYHALLKSFEALTGCPLLVNTSFNVRGEPLVCSVEDAYRCFMRTDMDYLFIGNFVLAKVQQEPAGDEQDWQQEYELD